MLRSENPRTVDALPNVTLTYFLKDIKSKTLILSHIRENKGVGYNNMFWRNLLSEIFNVFIFRLTPRF